MPRTNPTMTIVRLLRILDALPRAPRRVSSRAVYARLRADGFDVTIRTVERDLQRLRLAVAIELDDVHKPYGWSLSRLSKSTLTG